MQQRKFLSLAAAAVLVLVALVGAGTASADRLCSTNVSPCPAGNIYASGTSISASLKAGATAKVTTSGGLINPTITCTASSVGLKTSSAGGGSGVAISGSLTSLSMSSCTSTNPSGCSSSGTVSGLPTSGSISHSSSFNGSLTAGAPAVKFTCSGLACTFGGSGNVTGSVSGGNPAGVTFSNQTLASAGGFGCPTKAVWSAAYSAKSPSAIWVTGS